jgi:hypothetical protein
MKPSIALWAMPFALVLLVLALAFGHFALASAAVTATATVAALVYIALAARRPRARRPVADLLALLPGHLLLLFGLGMLDRPDALAFVWAALPLGSVVYDALSVRRPFRGRTSILFGLYAILWLVVFFLLERLIVVRKGLSGHAEVGTAVAFGAVGLVFVVVGFLRHRRAVEE